jgi:hypothetical protein
MECEDRNEIRNMVESDLGVMDLQLARAVHLKLSNHMKNTSGCLWTYHRTRHDQVFTYDECVYTKFRESGIPGFSGIELRLFIRDGWLMIVKHSESIEEGLDENGNEQWP